MVGGEKKKLFWSIINQCTSKLPKNKPRYCMGVGFPIDLIICSSLGVDMFDCVYPCRTARFGTVLVSEGILGVIKLTHNIFQTDLRSVDPNCRCYLCQRYTKSILHSFFVTYYK